MKTYLACINNEVKLRERFVSFEKAESWVERQKVPVDQNIYIFEVDKTFKKMYTYTQNADWKIETDPVKIKRVIDNLFSC